MSGYAFANLDSPAPDFLRMAARTRRRALFAQAALAKSAAGGR
jgi:hypothetical protein